MKANKTIATATRALVALMLVLAGASCAADASSESVEGTEDYTAVVPGEAMDDLGAAGVGGFYDLSPDEELSEKEPGWSGTGANWTLMVRTGCDTAKNAGTDALVRAQKRQYDYYDRYRVESWVDRTYTLDNLSANDNQYCSNSYFTSTLFNSLANPYAVITRLRLWHDNAGSAPGWYVEYATLTWSDSRRSARYRCIFNRWIYKDEVAEASCAAY